VNLLEEGLIGKIKDVDKQFTKSKFHSIYSWINENSDYEFPFFSYDINETVTNKDNDNDDELHDKPQDKLSDTKRQIVSHVFTKYYDWLFTYLIIPITYQELLRDLSADLNIKPDDAYKVVSVSKTLVYKPSEDSGCFPMIEKTKNSEAFQDVLSAIEIARLREEKISKMIQQCKVEFRETWTNKLRQFRDDIAKENPARKD